MTKPVRRRRRTLDGPASPHAVHVEDHLWAQAVAVAQARNESLSAVLRQKMRRYVEQHRDLLPDHLRSPRGD